MLILGLTTHFVNLMGSMEPIGTMLSEPLKKNLRVANPQQLKPHEAEIPCSNKEGIQQGFLIRISKMAL